MKIIHKLGLPYMGSKRRLAKPILGYILKHNPNTKYLYDVFGGGGKKVIERLFSNTKDISEKIYAQGTLF